jgi:poly(A) polymerase
MPDDSSNPSNKPPCRREDALAVLTALRDAGHVAYFAGGCVRDLLLGLTPKDWDVATDAPPRRVRELFPQTQAVGAAFGVILVRYRASTVEVATFRTDGSYSDGRRPDSVAFTTAEGDAKRRDFTINGLFLDPLSGAAPHGTVIDYVGGVADLEDQTLRAIGEPELRFAEDHLRLLRAVRFAARFGFAVEPRTAAAIRTHAPRLRGISPERIADELRLMLTAPSRAIAWPMLWEYALVDILFRFLPSAENAEFDPTRSIFLRLAPGQPISFGLALAAATLDYRRLSGADLLALCARPEIIKTSRAMREALRISNEEQAELEGALAPLPALLSEDEPRLAAKKRFLAMPAAPQSRALLRAIASLNEHAPRITNLENEFDKVLKTDVAPPPLITGDDLLTAGFKSGPAFRKVLEAVYDAQLEDRITTKDVAMALARQILQNGAS